MKNVPIPATDIAEAQRRGACPEALAWLDKAPRTVADLVAENREWAKWAATNMPTSPEVSAALALAGCGRSYWRDGRRHREDGPAMEWADGARSWYRDGLLHREDGPAMERADGTRAWYRDGARHREDGPAIEWADGTRTWWRDGVHIPNPEGKRGPQARAQDHDG